MLRQHRHALECPRGLPNRPAWVRVWVLGLAVGLVLASSPARAEVQDMRVALDDAELSPSYFPGLDRLRLFVAPVNLGGSLLPVTSSKPLTLRVGAATRKVPTLLGAFGGSNAELAITFVVQVGAEYGDDLADLGSALKRTISTLPRHAKVALVTYGEAVTGGHTFRGADPVAKDVAGLIPDSVAAEPHLLDAIKRAVHGLGRLKPETSSHLRRVIVVVSDGKDLDPSPQNYRTVSNIAAAKHIRIHSLAYSPVDNRRPLIGLGELSKRTGGTFRWARSRAGLEPQLSNLLTELNRQYVLTMFVDPRTVAGKKITLEYGGMVSNSVKVPAPRCGSGKCAADEYCARAVCTIRGSSKVGGFGSVLKWIGIVGGGILAVLFVVGLVLGRSGSAAPTVAPIPHATGRPSQPRGVQPVGPQGEPSDTSVPIAPSSAGGQLVGVTGQFHPRNASVVHGMFMGADRRCGLAILGDASVAAFHAQLLVDGRGNCFIIDKGSQTGTFVNGVRVTKQLRLSHGFRIRVGNAEIMFTT